MPFEISPKDISPAARLAALIEAGVAANPDLRHGEFYLLDSGHACAIGFAALASGISRSVIQGLCGYGETLIVAKKCGIPDDVAIRAVRSNDRGESIPEICESLRSGELSKVPA